MPFPAPFKAENIFSTYDPNFMPGYGGYVPKLRSQIGETFGNATLGLLSYEPGQPKSQRLTLTQTKPLVNPQVPRHLLNRTFGHPEMKTYAGHVQETNIKNGYFYPRDGKYHFALRNYTYDNNPESTLAVQTIEELKQREMDTCKRSEMMAAWPSWRPEPATSTEDIKPPNICTYHPPSNIHLDYSDPCPPGMILHFPRGTNYRYTQPEEKNSRKIYPTRSGLLPNYNGYVPGQSFEFGKRWGKSTVNAVECSRNRPWLSTSLI